MYGKARRASSETGSRNGRLICPGWLGRANGECVCCCAWCIRVYVRQRVQPSNLGEDSVPRGQVVPMPQAEREA